MADVQFWKMPPGFGPFSSLSKVQIYFFLLFTSNLSYFSSFKLPYKIRLLAFRSPLSSLRGRQRPGWHQLLLKRRFSYKFRPSLYYFSLDIGYQNYPIAEFVKSAVLPFCFTFDSISAIKLVRWVVPSPCETWPNNNKKTKMNKIKKQQQQQIWWQTSPLCRKGFSGGAPGHRLIYIPASRWSKNFRGVWSAN